MTAAALNDRRLLAAATRTHIADPDVLAALDELRGIPPRRAGARRRGLAAYRRTRPVPFPEISRTTRRRNHKENAL